MSDNKLFSDEEIKAMGITDVEAFQTVRGIAYEPSDEPLTERDRACTQWIMNRLDLLELKLRETYATIRELGDIL